MQNPEVDKFLNESSRPMGEKLRAIYHALVAWRSAYLAGPGDTVYNAPAGDVIDDGRQAEGVHTLTAGDVLYLNTIIETQLLPVFTPGVLAAIEKFCVRPVEVN